MKDHNTGNISEEKGEKKKKKKPIIVGLPLPTELCKLNYLVEEAFYHFLEGSCS